jgi:RNA polymerase sigma-70 factor, ECF subfamily
MERDPGKVLDELLVVSARAGSAAAFGQLVGRWSPRLQRHAQRLLRDPEPARDAVQDAWVSMARGLRWLDDPARFGGWAYAIVGRRCVDMLRRAVRDRRLSALAAREAALAGAADPRGGADARVDLAAAIDRLPVDQRLLVSLHYGEGLRVDEIAAGHGLPVGTVKSRLHAARQALKDILQGADHDQC